MSAGESPQLDRATVDGLLKVARDLSGTDDLPTMLAIFARGITEVADFECAAINLVRVDGDLQVVAVAGPREVETTLMGVVGGRVGWDIELMGGQRVGAVQLHLGDSVDRDFPVWVSEDAAWFERTAGDPRAWQPSFAAYVPIHEPNGSLLGVISVDLPRSGRIPDERQCATLEILARQAESAIVSARESAQSVLDEHIFGSVFEIAGAPMCVADQHGRLTHGNRRFREHFGDAAEIRALDGLLSEVEGAVSLQAEVDAIFAGRSGESTFVAGARGPEGWFWYHLSLRGAAYSSTTPSRIVCTMTDISAERRVRERHRHDAEHDQLTGLLNRRGMRAAIDAVVGGLGSTEVLVVLYCDLDGFKQANDLLGHRFGDGLLVEVADRLRAAVPTAAVVGRAGGDEFLIVAGRDTTGGAAALADAVVGAIDLPIPRSARRITISVGMAISAPDDPVAIGHLFQTADDVLYTAKLAGGGRWILTDA